MFRGRLDRRSEYPYVGWGRSSRLYNDGWLDLFVVNGHVYPQIEGPIRRDVVSASCLSKPPG